MKLRRWRVPFVVPIAAMALVHCGSGDRRSGSDTSRPATTGGALPTTPRAAPLAWDPDLGPAVAIPDPATRQALLIEPAFTTSASLDSLSPDAMRLRGASFDLFQGGARIGEVVIAGVSANPAAACAGWPVAELRSGGPGGTTPDQWTMAVPSGRAEAMPFDSLPGLSSQDSLSLTIAIARAASTLDDDTSGTFQGRPFIVRQANRFALSPDRDGVLAEVIRTVNQEANPVQEQLLLLLDGEWRRPDSALRVLYHARTVGLEENIRSVELLIVLRTRVNGAVSLVLRREGPSGWALELIGQSSANRWRLRWRSAESDC